MEGFLKAVEADEKHTWVVLHLYYLVMFSDKHNSFCDEPLIAAVGLL